jgi:hypothetical protein
LQDPPKFTQIGIFDLKTNHLATLTHRRKNPFIFNQMFHSIRAFEWSCWQRKETVSKIQLGLNAGLPDGLFAFQKAKFWYILEGLEIENDTTYCGKLMYFT